MVSVVPSIAISAAPFSALNVNTSPSTSLADKSTERKESSSIVWSGRSEITGASFTAFTVSVKLPDPEAWPSLASTLTKISPLKLAAGETVRVEPSIPTEPLASTLAWNVRSSPSTSAPLNSNI